MRCRSGSLLNASSSLVPPAGPPRYDTAQLFVPSTLAAPAHARGWLRGVPPSLLRLDGPSRLINVPTELVSELVSARACLFGQQPLSTAPRAYNPSIVEAPSGLCERCAYLATVRMSTEHQCDASGQTLVAASRWTGFANTALLALDSAYRVQAATWLLHSVEDQIINGTVVGGSRVHDVRLFRHGRSSRLFLTYHCHHCVFAVRYLRVTATPIRPPTSPQPHTRIRLRAWSTQWDKFVLTDRWLQGRNQVLFTDESGIDEADRGRGVSAPREPADARASKLLLQPYIGVVASLGAPAFERRRGKDFFSARSPLPRIPIEGVSNHLGDARNTVRRQLLARRGLAAFGAVESVVNDSARLFSDEFGLLRPRQRSHRRGEEAGSDLAADGRDGRDGFQKQGQASSRVQPWSRSERRVRHPSKRNRRATRRARMVASDRPPLSPLPMLSPTAHLIRISRLVDGQPQRRCSAFLGIGHLHHGQRAAPPQRGTPRWYAWARARKAARYRWGYNYSHFFYTLAPRWPHRMLATSGEWCIPSRRVVDDPVAEESTPAWHTRHHHPGACEAVQFVSGLAARTRASLAQHEPDEDGNSAEAKGGTDGLRPTRIVLAWGANDCEALVGVVAMRNIWSALVPLESNSSSCERADVSV